MSSQKVSRRKSSKRSSIFLRDNSTIRQDSSGVLVTNVQEKTKIQKKLRNIFKDAYNYALADTQYFHDGLRKIDFILASIRKKTPEEMDYLADFLVNLERRGVQYEFEYGITVPEMVFIKLHAAEYILVRIAHIRRIKLTRDNDRFQKARKVHQLFATPIHRPELNKAIFLRAKSTLTYVRPRYMTSTERSFCMYRILNRAKFGQQFTGVHSLIDRGVIRSAYPMHEGNVDWPVSGKITERQLLLRYWGTGFMWYKEQPLFLIHKYYGPEIAFYFAFLGFYNKMLIYASVAGVLCFAHGISLLWQSASWTSEICESSIIMCPAYACERNCKKFEFLNMSCALTKLSILVDNNATVLFSIFMSFWATITMELWKRRQNQLQFKWNLINVEESTVLRQQFQETARHKRISLATGELVPYTPLKEQLKRYTYSVSIIIIAISIICGFVTGIIFYRITVQRYIQMADVKFLKQSGEIFSMITAALMNVAVIKIFGWYYQRIAVFTTEIENPRTVVEFRDSCIYKMYTLSFVNNYLPYLYTAFILGKFYTYPGMNPSFQGLREDQCHPAGCLMGLFIQLSLIVLFNSYLGKLIMSFVPLTRMFIDRFLRSRARPKYTFILPQWELDYKLNDPQKFFLSRHYCEVVIQYGMVTFYVAAFPLAPLMALINNTIDLRLQAYKYLMYHRRPVARRLPGIGAWNGILQAATHICTITSAFVIAFTSEFIPREYYRIRNGNLDGLMNSSLSMFDTSRFPENFSKNCVPKGLKYCYYRGYRHPPGHKDEYDYTMSYWQIMLIRLVFVVAYEHSIWFLTGVLSYIIPDVPFVVKKQLQYETQLAREYSLAYMNIPKYDGPKTKFL